LLGRRQLEKLSLGYQTRYILSTRIPENIDEAGFFKKIRFAGNQRDEVPRFYSPA